MAYLVCFYNNKNSSNDLLSVDPTIKYSSLFLIFDAIFKLFLHSLFHKIIVFFFYIYLLFVATVPPAQLYSLDRNWEGTHGKRTSWPTFLRGDFLDASRLCYGDINCSSCVKTVLFNPYNLCPVEWKELFYYFL